jgi:hypothetical protein
MPNSDSSDNDMKILAEQLLKSVLHLGVCVCYYKGLCTKPSFCIDANNVL